MLFKVFHYLLIIVFLFSFSFNLYAGETGKIAGRITDKKTTEPLIGANVMIVGKWVDGKEQVVTSILGSSTDINGDYFILNIPPGLYSVRASFIGYQTEIITQIQVDVDKTSKVDFALTSEVYQTGEVIIVAHSKQKVETDLTSTKQVYNVREIESIAGVADVGDILELQADVIDDHFRGGRVGESVYLLGGGSIINPLNNQRAFSPIVTGLEQVEVYTSGFSAEYGNAQSGVVNMVTREAGDKWETRLEVSGTAPYYKNWGGSVYSPDNLKFYTTLTDLNQWLTENPTQPGRLLFDAGYGFGSTYLPPRNTWPPNPLTLQDSLEIAKLGQIAWLQSVRDVGMEYNNTVDYRIDMTIGGPLTKDLKFFFAGRQDIVNPRLPTAASDKSRQLLSSLSYQPNPYDKIKLSLIYDSQFDNYFDSNWLRWMFDRTFSISQINQSTAQVGLEWKHLFDQSRVLDLKFNYLNLSSEQRIELLTADQYVNTYANLTNWVDYTGPSGHRVGRLTDDRGNDNTQSYDFHGNLLAQINNTNLIKTGLMFTYYNLDVTRELNVVDDGSYRAVDFNSNPYEGAVYIQDKLEFEGLIANVGIRFDFYNFNYEYYSDIFSPLRNPYYDPTKPYSERGQYYDQNLAAKEKTELYTRIQPRIGISFPISEYSVIHLNYGTFTQRPSFDMIYYNQVTKFNEIEILGNPRLKPENTGAYDIGLVNAFPIGLTLDVSAYYKDVTDLVESAYFYDESKTVYQTFINRDYADIKGFHVSLEKTDGSFTGFIRYNYESATGKSSNAFNAPVIFNENPSENEEAITLPDPEDVYLDYDRTHKGVMNLRYQTARGTDLFSDISISTTFRVFSGRPYTYDETGQGLKYNRRTPVETDLRLRIEKRIRFGNSQILTIYGEGYNLINQENYNYSRTFVNEQNLTKWIRDESSVLTYTEFPPYYTDQSIYILSNQPIHFRFGLIYRF